MDHPIPKLKTGPLSLHDQVVNQVLLDATQRIKAVDDNAALIAQCEKLRDALNVAAGRNLAAAIITPHERSVSALVSTFLEPVGDVRRAISKAGLHIYTEHADLDGPLGNARRLEFVGYDVTLKIYDDNIAGMAEAA